MIPVHASSSKYCFSLDLSKFECKNLTLRFSMSTSIESVLNTKSINLISLSYFNQSIKKFYWLVTVIKKIFFLISVFVYGKFLTLFYSVVFLFFGLNSVGIRFRFRSYGFPLLIIPFISKESIA